MTCLRAWAKDVPHSRVVLRILHKFTATLAWSSHCE